MAPLVLASTSPRRRELLQQTGLSFITVASPADELHDESIPFTTLCQHNARAKAQAVAPNHPSAIVIGADTLVSLRGIPLGKPKDHDDARRMLEKLSGQTNEVCTAGCLCLPDGPPRDFHNISTVHFRHLSAQTISDYMTKVNTLDKAGAYAIQEHGDMIIDRIEGDMHNIIGLPVGQLLENLQSISQNFPHKSENTY